MTSIGRVLLHVFLIIFTFHGKNYNTVQGAICGGDLVGSSGSFTSPNYPEHYPDNQQCTWCIQVSHNQKIKLEFVDLQIETSPSCGRDYILIYDGPSRSSQLIAKSCTAENRVLISSSNVMTVYFRSNEMVAARGFAAKYKSLPLHFNEPSCGGSLLSNFGTFTSPNYPQYYPNLAACTWYIRAANNQIIFLHFTDIDIEYEANCRFDHVEIYTGPSTDSPLIGLTCTLSENIFLINSNTATVHFTTDRSVVNRGFSANYRTMQAGAYCGGHLRGNHGSFTSPNYPESYPNNVQCTWHISVDNGQRIILDLGYLRLKTSQACIQDYVEIYDGPSTDSILIARVCHPSNPYFTSSSNNMTVYFRSDYSATGGGFKAKYTTQPSTIIWNFHHVAHMNIFKLMMGFRKLRLCLEKYVVD
ncbi:deleted in malignant brain tumors 1 protein-like isoform X2 [Heterodontus francisci]|uniref:deleted in malignant brain tumors 1 protein-like isoform X2 n=1 Tax=Heterodontus francisci TaxID=7792 RepID=UPI00355B086F